MKIYVLIIGIDAILQFKSTPRSSVKIHLCFTRVGAIAHYDTDPLCNSNFMCEQF